MWGRWQKGDSMNAIIGVEVPVLVSKQPYTKRNFQRCDWLDAAITCPLSPSLAKCIRPLNRQRNYGIQASHFNRVGCFGKWRNPIHARAPIWLATVSTGGALWLSVHHCPTKATIPTRAWA